jgi:hypothetical protein
VTNCNSFVETKLEGMLGQVKSIQKIAEMRSSQKVFSYHTYSGPTALNMLWFDAGTEN